MLLPSLAPFCQAVSEEKIFLTLANQKQELPLAAWDEMKKLYRGPYIDAFCQVWFHLVQLFQRSKLKYEKVNGRQVMAIPHMTLWVRWAKKNRRHICPPISISYIYPTINIRCRCICTPHPPPLFVSGTYIL